MLGGNHLTSLPLLPTHPLPQSPFPAIPRLPDFSIPSVFFHFPFLTTAKFYDILYIQSEEKQGYLHSLRSVSPHRYLRSISWNGHRPPPSTSWGLPSRAAVRTRVVFAAVPTSSCALAATTPHPRKQRKHLLVLPKEKERQSSFFLSRASHTSLLLCCAVHEPHAHHPRCLPRPLYRPPLTSLSAAFHKQKNAGPQHCAANPLTTFVERAQKSVDFPLKKAHVGTPGLHALASAARTYSLTARIHYNPFSFLLFYKGKEKRK